MTRVGRPVLTTVTGSLLAVVVPSVGLLRELRIEWPGLWHAV